MSILVERFIAGLTKDKKELKENKSGDAPKEPTKGPKGTPLPSPK